MSDLKHIDTAYKNWIAALSARFKQSQIKAAVRVNNELLSFYWQLGKDIVELDAESRWGKGVMKSISDDLKSELPGVSGLSPTNLYYMKWFYQTYSQGTAFLPQLGVKSHDRILPQLGGESKNPQDVLILFSIPWTHHKYILDKYKNNPEKETTCWHAMPWNPHRSLWEFPDTSCRRSIPNRSKGLFRLSRKSKTN